MQLKDEKSPSPVRDILHTAVLAMLLVPATAKAQTADTPDRIEFTSLLYGEQGRTQVVEPLLRLTHQLGNGQSLSAQFGIDVITGASPSGALPSGEVQTHTTASGRVVSSAPGQIPTTQFHDQRLVLNGSWQAPLGRFFTSNISGHVSHEKDYQSLGADANIEGQFMQRLLTVTIGGGTSRDTVSPVGGTPIGLSDGLFLRAGGNPKDVSNLIFGVSRILTRRWMVSVNGTRTFESGYLTEPYKLVSLMNPVSGVPMGTLTDKRPSSRDRSSLLFSSVYHLTNDVLYTSYRYYWDTWDVRSHTVEARYRHDLGTELFVEPLLRYYAQSAAAFYVPGLVQGAPLPDFATSDYRLGKLQTITLGSTFGYHPADAPGEWVLRAEIIRQSGDSSPPGVIGVQRKFDLSPPVNIVAIVLGYSFGY